LESEISSIAVCAGSGASVLVNAGKVDLWITGEMGHHEALDCQEKNISVLLAEHSNTERGFLSRFQANIMVSWIQINPKNVSFYRSFLKFPDSYSCNIIAFIKSGGRMFFDGNLFIL
jgi:putative NIF3 family GTP cyclohydrolase 1 type 2